MLMNHKCRKIDFINHIMITINSESMKMIKILLHEEWCDHYSQALPSVVQNMCSNDWFQFEYFSRPRARIVTRRDKIQLRGHLNMMCFMHYTIWFETFDQWQQEFLRTCYPNRSTHRKIQESHKNKIPFITETTIKPSKMDAINAVLLFIIHRQTIFRSQLCIKFVRRKVL